MPSQPTETDGGPPKKPKKLLDRLKARYRGMLEPPPEGAHRFRRMTHNLLSFTLLAVRELGRNRAPEMAASLTYRTLFSLLPTIALALVVLSAFVGPEEQESFKNGLVELMVGPMSATEEDAPDELDLIAIEAGNVGARMGTAWMAGLEMAMRPGLGEALLGGTGLGTGAGVGTGEGSGLGLEAGEGSGIRGPPVVAELAPLVTPEDQTDGDDERVTAGAEGFNDARGAIEERVGDAIAQLSAIDLTSIGWVGMLLFIYAATGLLAAIEQHFGRIFNVSQRRSWGRRLPLYYSVVTLGPLLILTGQWVRQLSLDWLSSASYLSWLGGIFSVLSPLITTWLVLFILFVAVPNTQVSIKPAAAGAFVSAVLAGLLATGLQGYVSNAAVANLYGALALLPLSLLWLYSLWLVVLLGLQLAYLLQTYAGRGAVSAGQALRQGGFVQAGWVLPVAIAIARRFTLGEVSTPAGLARRLNLPPQAVTALLLALERAEVVTRVTKGKRTGYLLARSADGITLEELLSITAPELERRTADWVLTQEVNRQRSELFVGRTLADAVRDAS